MDTIEQVTARIAELDRAARGRKFTDDERDEWHRLNARWTSTSRASARARLAELANRAATSSARPARRRPGARPAELSADRSAALATLERFTRAGTLTPAAADRLDCARPARRPARTRRALPERPWATRPTRPRSRRSSPTRPTATCRHEPAEVEAMRVVARVEAERAAMAGGADATGGFALPLSLDPAVLLSSSGALNPIRQLARVITITTRQWQGVSSDGVVASYDPEAARGVRTTRPTLAGPTITTAMGRVLRAVQHGAWGRLGPRSRMS